MPPKNWSCMKRSSKTVRVAPLVPPPEPNSISPVSVASIVGGAPGVARVTVSPRSKPPLSMVSTSSAISYGASGSSPRVSATIGLPVSEVAEV